MKRLKNGLLNAIQKKDNRFLNRLTRGCLFCLSVIYRTVVRIRNWAYDKQWLKSHSVDAFVISIGNLTTGGTGKTPMVIWLANQLANKYPTAIVSRGYGAQASGQLNDEGMEIAWRTDNIVQVQNPDRVTAASVAIQQLGKRSGLPTVILDDAFQHRRLNRDLNIVLVDATNPFGFDYLLPRGLLREDVTEIKRADVVVLSRADQIAPHVRQAIRSEVLAIHPNVDWAETTLIPKGWCTIDREPIAFGAMLTTPVFMFSGIGNPSAYQHTLDSIGIQIKGVKTFEDHYDFKEKDIQELVNEAKRLGCDALVCTVKDLVKIQKSSRPELPIYALQTEIEFLSGEERLMRRIGTNLTKLKNAG